jgi:hypothetical protein
MRVFCPTMFMKKQSLTSVENDMNAEMVHTSSSIGANFSRPLGTMEQFLWLLDQTEPTHFSIAVEIEGLPL